MPRRIGARGEELPAADLYPEEHRLAPSPAWNAYKAAVRAKTWIEARDRIDDSGRLLEAAP